MTAAFLDPARIGTMIRASQEEREAADQPCRERLDIIAREIATRRRRLDRTTAELLDADEDSESYASLKRTQATLNRELQQFKAEQTSLEAAKPKTLTAEQALSLQEAAERIMANMDGATTETLREVYGLLDLRGRVREDPANGLPFGKHRFHIDWEGMIPINSNEHILL